MSEDWQKHRILYAAFFWKANTGASTKIIILQYHDILGDLNRK